MNHIDYPHDPGFLYDCPACENECFCADGYMCIACITEDQMNTLEEC